MLDRSVTREVFEGLGPTGEAVFYVLAAIATAVFLERGDMRGELNRPLDQTLTAPLTPGVGEVQADAPSHHLWKYVWSLPPRAIGLL